MSLYDMLRRNRLADVLAAAAFLVGCSSPSESTASSSQEISASSTVRVTAPTMPTVPARRPVNIVTDGDSITFGYGVEPGHTWPDQLARLRPGASVHNVAVSGNTVRDRASAAPTVVDPLLVDGDENELVIFAGTNDFAHGYDAPSTLSALWAYCEARRSAGWRVYVATMLTRADGLDLQTTQVPYNAGILSQWAEHSDGVVDVAADPRLTDATDAVWFQPGALHPTAAGDAVLADVAARVLP